MKSRRNDQDMQFEFRRFYTYAGDCGILAEDCGHGRWKAHGKLRTVTWWPFSTKRAAKISGVPEPRLGATQGEVIAWARGGAVRPNEKQETLFTNEGRSDDYD